MSKPLFRLNLTAAQTVLLAELVSKVAVPAAQAGALAGIFDQIQAAKKYWGCSDISPLPPPADGK